MHPWLSWHSLCIPGCTQTYSNPPVSASQVLLLETCTTISGTTLDFKNKSLFFFLKGLYGPVEHLSSTVYFKIVYISI